MDSATGFRKDIIFIGIRVAEFVGIKTGEEFRSLAANHFSERITTSALIRFGNNPRLTDPDSMERI